MNTKDWVKTIWKSVNEFFNEYTLAKFFLQFVVIGLIGIIISDKLAFDRSKEIRKAEIFQQETRDRYEFLREFYKGAYTRKFRMRDLYWELNSGYSSNESIKNKIAQYENAKNEWNIRIQHLLSSLYLHFEKGNYLIKEIMAQDTKGEIKEYSRRYLMANFLKELKKMQKNFRGYNLYKLGEGLQDKFRKAHYPLKKLTKKSTNEDDEEGRNLNKEKISELKEYLDELDKYCDNYMQLLFFLAKELSNPSTN